MTCPYCRHEFPLTWARYWKAALGRHVCPNCGRTSRLPVTAGYLAKATLAVFTGAVPAAIATFMLGGSELAQLVAAAVGGLVVGIWVDKTLLDSRRPLVCVEDK